MDAYHPLLPIESGHGLEIGLELIELVDRGHGQEYILESCRYGLDGQPWNGLDAGNAIHEIGRRIGVEKSRAALLHPHGAVGIDNHLQHPGTGVDGIPAGGQPLLMEQQKSGDGGVSAKIYLVDGSEILEMVIGLGRRSHKGRFGKSHPRRDIHFLLARKSGSVEHHAGPIASGTLVSESINNMNLGLCI